MPTITYHDRLRRARLDAGLDQPQLAARTGLSTSTISAVERGHRDLTAPRLFAWARECKVSLEWIAGEPVTSPAPALDMVQLDLELAGPPREPDPAFLKRTIVSGLGS